MRLKAFPYVTAVSSRIKRETKKLQEVGYVTTICFSCFFIRCIMMCFNAFDKAADLDVLDHPILNLIYYLKMRSVKASDLETQPAQLQDELKKAKDQLSSSESLKKKAQQDTDEAKKQLAAMSEKLEDSKKQLLELSDSEEARLLELRKISQDRDRAWQSELEAIQKQHELDSAILASAMNEIQKLKIQLDRVADSEAAQARHESAYAEIESLRIELTKTFTLVEKLRNQLNDSK